MPEGQGVATTRRRLRTELRRLRDAAGLHQTEVVKQLDWSISKLIRIENGSVGVSVTDVRALAALYGAEPELVEELVRLARVTRARQWWSSYRHVLSPSHREYIAYEADASAIYVAHPTAVPGLLQTEDYIRAILAPRLDPASPERIEAEFDVRRRRQREILHSGHPPAFHVILDESALRRHIGGVKVMRTQLEHLASLPDDLVSIAVWPLRAGAHVAMQGAFTVMEFANEGEPGVLFLESAAAGNPIERDQDQVHKYRRAFDAMMERCLVGADARSLIRTIADDLDRST